MNVLLAHGFEQFGRQFAGNTFFKFKKKGGVLHIIQKVDR